ncbi:MAG: MBL fold metallo-hydrolase [Euryarchaeota archaeon]|nr:MBL fold metallo-hydrolase [Euryarchaeota archaeon]
MSEPPRGMDIHGVEARAARPSASLMLTRDGDEGVELLLARRVDELPAFPGYWAFPGGGVGRVDRSAVELIPLLTQMEDTVEAATHAGMHRELVEELGFAVSEKGQLFRVEPALRDRILADKSEWMKAVLSDDLPLQVDAFIELTRRTTPEFAPMRFENRFMFMHCTSEVPEPALEGQTEFDEFRWIKPSIALEEWYGNEIKIPPPIVTILQEVVDLQSEFSSMQEIADDICLRQPPERTILFAPGVECIPIPTATLPPATTTNSYLLGMAGGEHILVDPAVRNEEGIARISRALQRMSDSGGTLLAYLFTHRHMDHLGDIDALLALMPAEIWASQETADALSTGASRILLDGDIIVLKNPTGSSLWSALITPGHCPGHVCLNSEAGLVVGDMVAGIGTILIPPAEGNMEVYLEQLQRLNNINAHLLFPAHGPVLPLPKKVFKHYLKHRQIRHDKVLLIVEDGTSSLDEIALLAYADTPNAHPILARQQTLSHLLSWQRCSRIDSQDGLWSPL